MITTRIVLVDDHSLVRAGIRTLLEAQADLRVVGEAGSGEEGEVLARELRPDIVLMDISMPGCGGIEATGRIRSGDGAPPVLILTMGCESEYLVPSTDAGAIGFLRKECADRDLFDAVRAVAGGRPYFAPGAARLLVQHFRRGRIAEPAQQPIDLLSDRERQVLVRVAAGYTSIEIGQQLRISPKTVDTYRARIQEKLGLHRRSELVRVAIEHNLLSVAA